MRVLAIARLRTAPLRIGVNAPLRSSLAACALDPVRREQCASELLPASRSMSFRWERTAAGAFKTAPCSARAGQVFGRDANGDDATSIVRAVTSSQLQTNVRGQSVATQGLV